jgi:lipopolysaccharide transport system permease protein
MLAANNAFQRPGSGRWLTRLWSARELLWALTVRDLQVRYKQSMLGPAWAIVQPLAQAIIFTLAFGYFVKVPTDGVPYPIFAYGAMVPWTLFSSAINSGSPSIVGHSSLITKTYFPREVLPLAAIASCFFDFLTASVVLIPMMIWFRMPPSVHLVWLPLLVGMILVFSAGITFALSALNVFWRDIRSVLPLALQLWMFASPIVYPITLVPERFRTLYSLNPMVGIIDGFRRVLLHRQAPDLPLLLLGLPAVFLTLLIGYRVFIALERRFADVV